MFSGLHQHAVALRQELGLQNVTLRKHAGTYAGGAHPARRRAAGADAVGHRAAVAAARVCANIWNIATAYSYARFALVCIRVARAESEEEGKD
jgi:hypothetical protein